MPSRRGKVYLFDRFVGFVEQREDEFVFTYDRDYLASEKPMPASLTLPLRAEAYRSKTMIPFFDGLIPEGWLLDIATKNWKISSNDRMGLLLASCRDCIGAASIWPEDEGAGQ